MKAFEKTSSIWENDRIAEDELERYLSEVGADIWTGGEDSVIDSTKVIEIALEQGFAIEDPQALNGYVFVKNKNAGIGYKEHKAGQRIELNHPGFNGKKTASLESICANKIMSLLDIELDGDIWIEKEDEITQLIERVVFDYLDPNYN